MSLRIFSMHISVYFIMPAIFSQRFPLPAASSALISFPFWLSACRFQVDHHKFARIEDPDGKRMGSKPP